MILRALSLLQPWASLVACGVKTVETRSWSTSYRGPLLICSTQSTPRKVFQEATTSPVVYERIRTKPGLGYPNGTALCVVELKACERAEDWIAREEANENHLRVANEKAVGNLSAGRWAWTLGAPKVLWSYRADGLTFPLISVKGKQGLWAVSEELGAEVTRRLEAHERLAAGGRA